MSVTNCLNYIGQLSGSECLMINEASSSKTAFFSYNSTFGVNPIIVNGKPKQKYSLSNPDKPEEFAADSYALQGNIQGYYDIIRNNPVITNHIATSNCAIFYWALLATGGMRNLADNEGEDVVERFYAGIQQMFNDNPNSCVGEVCKKIVLIRAETITGGQEGQYAWLTLQSLQNVNCHAVIDLGGQTGQFANQSFAFSGYLGKDRAIGKMESGSASDDDAGSDNIVYYNYTSTQCYNDKGLYDGAQCRTNIQSYISTSFGNELPLVNYAQYCHFYTISNFYNYFNDVCNTYLPYILNNNLPINPSTLIQMQYLCLVKNQQGQPLIMGINGYQNITDEVCAHWNNNWIGNTANYAKDACFSGNYNYEVLKAFGLSDEQLIRVQFIGDDISVDQADWALGAAVDSAAVCNTAPTPTPTPTNCCNEVSNLYDISYALIAATSLLGVGVAVLAGCMWSTRDQMFRLKLATAAKFAHLDGTLLGFNARLDQTGHDFGQYLETIGANVQALSASVSSLIDRVTALEEHTGSHAPLIGNHHGDHHHA